MKGNVFTVLISSLLSGLLAVAVTVTFYQHQDVRKAKLDTLRRLTGYRWCLAAGKGSQHVRDQFFSAMNEAVVVFNDSSEVVSALQKFSDHIKAGQRDQLNDDVITLIKAMCKDLGLQYPLNDALLKRPFLHTQDVLPNKPSDAT